jgi:putative component of membrane protein insertase Oxa1/YidC/SpoIIIJ protein YidD
MRKALARFIKCNPVPWQGGLDSLAKRQKLAAGYAYVKQSKQAPSIMERKSQEVNCTPQYL